MNAPIRRLTAASLAAAALLAFSATLPPPPALAAPAARPAPKAPVDHAARLEVNTTEVTASPELVWAFEMKLVNAGTLGLYVDSVLCRIEDTSPGETGAARVQLSSLTAVARGLGAVSAGDSTQFSQTVPASCESGKLDLQIFAHRNDGESFSVSAPTITLLPGEVSLAHPSEFLPVGGKPVELVTFPAIPEGPAAGLLLAHDHGAHARQLLQLAMLLSMRGYTVGLVSLPGYGRSEGPADFAGPRTQAALAAALDRLKRTPGVDSTRVAAWGIGRGAGAVASLAEQRSDLEAVVVQAGVYDLWAAYRGARRSGVRETILAEAGKDSSAWSDRSPIRRASSLRGKWLVLHGEADGEAPVDQARAFVALATAAGATVQARWFPAADHALPRGDVQRSVIQFLDTALKR